MIQELLSRGRENAKTKRELMQALDLDSERAFNQQLERERAAGAIICSCTDNGGGYFLPANRAEIRAFVRSMENRARNTMRAVRAAKLILEMGGGVDGETENKVQT